MAEPWLLLTFDLLLFRATHSIPLSAVPGSVWFCVNIHRVYRMCITKPKTNIFHCGLLNKDNSTWLSVLGLFWILCVLLLRSNSMNLSNTLRRLLQFSWPEAALPHNHVHNLFLSWTYFSSTILLSSVHHSLLILFSSWTKYLTTFWNFFLIKSAQNNDKKAQQVPLSSYFLTLHHLDNRWGSFRPH